MNGTVWHARNWSWWPVMLVMVLLVSCSSAPAATATAAASTPASSPAGPADKVTFLTDFALYGYATPFFAGVAEGFFKAENIDLTVLPGGGSADTSSKVGANAAQFGLADPINVLMALDKGVPLVMIAAHWQKHVGGFCFVTTRKKLQKLEDFQNLSFGGVVGDSYYAILQKLMEAKGIATNKMVFNSMTSANATAALYAGQIDSASCGIATYPSRVLDAKKSGVDLGFFSLAQNGLDAIGHVIITNKSLIDTKPDLVQRFMRAYAKSTVWTTLNVDAAVADYIKANPTQPDASGHKAILTAVQDYYVDSSAAGNKGQFYFPPAKTQNTITQVNDWFGLKVDGTAAYTNKFVDQLSPALLQGKLP